MKHFIISMLTLSSFIPTCYAQNKLSDQEIAAIKKDMAENPECRTHLMWLEDDGRTDYYLRTAPERCLDELQALLGFSESWHSDNNRILQLKQQIYPKPGSSKSERHYRNTSKMWRKLSTHSNVPERLKNGIRK